MRSPRAEAIGHAAQTTNNGARSLWLACRFTLRETRARDVVRPLSPTHIVHPTGPDTSQTARSCSSACLTSSEYGHISRESPSKQLISHLLCVYCRNVCWTITWNQRRDLNADDPTLSPPQFRLTACRNTDTACPTAVIRVVKRSLVNRRVVQQNVRSLPSDRPVKAGVTLESSPIPSHHTSQLACSVRNARGPDGSPTRSQAMVPKTIQDAAMREPGPAPPPPVKSHSSSILSSLLHSAHPQEESITSENKLNLIINHSQPIFELISESTTYEAAVGLNSIFIKPTSEIFARYQLASCKQRSDEKTVSLKQLAPKGDNAAVIFKDNTDQSVLVVDQPDSNISEESHISNRDISMLDVTCSSPLDRDRLAPHPHLSKPSNSYTPPQNTDSPQQTNS
ncbi:hypothetical protein J6590_028853 [Homalodisca vitripennis]|nr:hypothetical protein J6590_028853 [Homalodisca vitripennis]